MRLVALVLVACSAPGASSSNDGGGGDGPPCIVHCDDEIAPISLMVSALGVGLSSVPGRNVVIRTLAVTASRGAAIAWTAEADQAWLHVTASGSTAEKLTITADPSGLAADHEYLGEVVVRSSALGVTNDQRVRVGLWVGAAVPQTVTLPIYVRGIVADPVTSALYTHTRGPDITVYDAYRGTVMRTFAGAVGRAGAMAVSSDGLILFVDDADAQAVVALDTGDGHELRRFAWGSTSSGGMAYARPDAHPLLFIGEGGVFDVATGVRAPARTSGGYDNQMSFAITPDGTRVFTQDRGVSPASIKRYEVSYDTRGVEPLKIASFGSIQVGSNGQGLCAGADGTRIYSAKGAPYEFEVFATADLAPRKKLAGDAYPRAAVCGWNGVFFGGNGGRVWAYRADDSLITDFALGADIDTLALSGDNARIAGSYSDFATGQQVFQIRSAPGP